MPVWLVDLYARYGYWAVFVGVCLENAGLPVPGETALLAGAALASFGRLSLSTVILVATIAAIIGDNIGFVIGRHGGRALAERYGPRIGLTPQRLAVFDGFFVDHGAKTVFIARFVTGLRVVGAVLAGGSGMPWRVFLFFNATGAIVWSTAIAIAGYMLGQSWETLERWIGRSGVLGLALVAIIAAGAWARRQRA